MWIGPEDLSLFKRVIPCFHWTVNTAAGNRIRTLVRSFPPRRMITRTSSGSLRTAARGEITKNETLSRAYRGDKPFNRGVKGLWLIVHDEPLAVGHKLNADGGAIFL